MDQHTHIYLFGDQTFDFSAGLWTLLLPSGDPILTSFLEGAFNALRAEVGELSRAQHAPFRQFSSLHDLIALRHESLLHPALEQALSCVYQLACFINANSGVYPKPKDSYLVGLYTGALAVAAVSSCRTLSELLPAAIHTVVVAFRTGLCAFNVGEAIEQAPEPPLVSWSMIASGLTFETASEFVKTFSQRHHLPVTSQPWISATSDYGATISGPPTVLASFRKSPELLKIKVMHLPIHAPYHAPHLFSELDVETILEKTSAQAWSAHAANIKVILSSSGSLNWAGNFRTLLQAALTAILLEPMRWDAITKAIASISASTWASPVIVYPIATTAEQALRSDLRHKGRSMMVSEGLESDHSGATPPLTSNQSTRATNATPSVDAASPLRPAQSKIAIIGMSGRFPESEDPDAFWKLLSEGLDVHKTVPPQHWNIGTHVDPSGERKNTSATPYGCWLSNPGLFDAKFFNMSPREAPQVDPAQRIALLTAYEAIEKAGIVPEATPSTQRDRVGVFYGVTSNDWLETNSAQNIDTYFIPGGNRAFIPGRINYFFKFSGPSYSVDTACSSSLAAIHIACNSLWRGDIDTAIAGGTNVLTNPDFTAGLDRGHFLSRTGNCKTFDESADGYCRGEGVGTVILKRLEDAITDNDPIQGLILGAYTNHSAEAESITRPHVGAQKAMFSKILHGAGVDPCEVSYVEMHGTGTQAGDAGEMQSVLETFAPARTRHQRRENQALFLGSAKANIGHGEAASGVTSLAKVLLMMNRNLIPPHCGIKTEINRRFPTNLEERRVFIAKKLTPWTRPKGGTRKVFLNNFSAAGGNSALLLEDAPPESLFVGADPRSAHVVAVSAKSATSLRRNVQSLISFLDDTRLDESVLPALSYTTTARRIHHSHRVAVSGPDLKVIQSKLQEALDHDKGSTRSPKAPSVVFAFTGQGSQYIGMGKQFLRSFASFRSDIHRFDQLAQSQGYPSFVSVISAESGEIADFTPLVVQIATVCFQMALARLWISWGVTPHCVVGHSLGEYAALNVAGVLSESDTIYVAGKRAQLLQDRCSRGTHSMLAVKASTSMIEGILRRQRYEIACVNGPEDVVISGTNDDVLDVQKALSSQQIKTIVLKVPYAFHSSQVEPILEEFQLAAEGVTFREATIPILCPLDGTVMNSTKSFAPKYLSDHCRQAVNILDATNAAKAAGVITEKSFVIEIGPQPVVSGMLKSILGPQITTMPSLQREMDTWPLITTALSTLYAAGTEIAWREYHRDFKSSHRVLQLPAYGWDLKEYWMQYVNDWSLRKGDPLPAVGNNTKPLTQAAVPKLESTTIHNVIEETVHGQAGTLVIESDIARHDLNPIVQGHRVDGIPLCTPSVYADIALTLGRYLLDRYQPMKKERLVDVAEMTITKALIAQPKGPQVLRTTVELDWTLNSAFCKFLSVNDSGQKISDHAHCTIRFQDTSKQRALQLEVSEIRSRMARLEQGIVTGKSYKFNKPMIYKMVSGLAQFDPNYRALNQINLDSDALEASSVVGFADVKTAGDFHTHPAYIDALSQAGGFVMNCNDKADLNVEVFVNHGWQSFQLFEELSATNTYQTHVSMHEKPGKMWEGNVMVLDGERVVAAFGGIVLQGVPRRLLGYVLSSEQGTKAPTKKPQKAMPVATAVVKPASKHDKAPPAPQKPIRAVSTPTQPVKVPETRIDESVTAQSDAPSQNNVSPALRIVSEESGIAYEELTDTSVFSDMGVDSLLSLLIISRFEDELGIEMGSTAFSDIQTVKELKKFLSPAGSEESINIAAVDSSDKPVPQVRSTSQVEVTATIPITKLDHAQTIQPQTIQPTGHSPPTPAVESQKDVFDFAQPLQIISEESGVAIPDLTDDCIFSDMGVDSLLSLIIVSRFSDELGVDLSSESSMFADYPTVGNLKSFLTGVGQRDIGASAVTTASSSHSSSSSLSGESSSEQNIDFVVVTPPTEIPSPSGYSSSKEYHMKELRDQPAPTRAATALIIQGRPKTDRRILFLFPDGSGSASSYANIPAVDSNLAVIGLNCPYRLHPAEMTTCALDDLIGSYVTEIRKHQPSGPYHLGGWSAGGILAYRATQQFISEGEDVHSLVLIDSPVPKGLDRLPQSFYDHCNSVGLFGKGQAKAPPPAWLVPHFNGTIDILHDYWAEPLVEGLTPKTSIIWASESVLDGVKFPKLPPGPDDTEGLKFLTEKRTDFSTAGWEDLFPGEEVTVVRADGADHFSIMAEHGDLLAAFIREATR